MKSTSKREGKLIARSDSLVLHFCNGRGAESRSLPESAHRAKGIFSAAIGEVRLTAHDSKKPRGLYQRDYSYSCSTDGEFRLRMGSESIRPVRRRQTDSHEPQ